MECIFEVRLSLFELCFVMLELFHGSAGLVLTFC